jgi:hypothetical protein
MTEEKKAPRKPVDWNAVEPHYRSGIRSLADIGKEFGCTAAAIVKHADKAGWTRDLKAKIVAKAEAKVNAAVVNAPVNAAKAFTENQVVEANAELQYQVRMRHRGDIANLRSLFVTLLTELKASSSPEGMDVLETMHDIVHGAADPEDKDGSRRAEKMREALNKALSGSTRVGSAKQLTEMLEKLIKLERQAFGIDDDENNGAGDLEKILAKIHAGLGQ